ncbi:hypothetical protein [Devosia nitrariae]|uniref:Uncharacterized protein n=1 Tax=Devosia nitrariae TaxID=2071872 RepID=A0ABQ5W159_9HYPH|nr:hypothetical protein [Devosia nitrariae]GLQ53632.1 hypothetical protein GCM10010862_08910 [Devosia nitrariae]
MSYRLIPPQTPVSAYTTPIVQVECHRCRRNAPSLEMDKLTKRFGRNLTVGQLALQVAGSGRRPCGLADSGQCSAMAYEPPPWMWAKIRDALEGNWLARMKCERHMAAMRRTSPCPEVTVLDVLTLAIALGHDFPLSRLPGRLRCPKCWGSLVNIDWVVPPTTPEPYAPAAADVTPLRLKPTGANLARKRLKVVNGGNE